ncbi:MAG: hypothetical protein IPL73_23555 [Candidatus Obscuribacter sp.]|nr:hypothetical protein [Candidatus Obscuribacter sp.]
MLEKAFSKSDALILERASSEYAAITRAWDVCLKTSSDVKNRMIVERDDGTIISSVTWNGDALRDEYMLAELRRRLEGELRWRLIKRLDNCAPSNPLKIEMRLVKVNVISLVTKWQTDGV